MDKKVEGLLTSAVILFLYMKFGSLVYWFFGLALAVTGIIYIGTMELLRIFSPACYNKACELHKKLIGFSYIEVVPPVMPGAAFNKKTVVLAVIATALSIMFSWLIYVRLSELVSPR